MKECKSLGYYEKLEELINDRDSESLEWRQSNEEKEGYVECEVTFKFKKLLVQDHYDKTEETIGMAQGLDSQSMTKIVQMAWDKPARTR